MTVGLRLCSPARPLFPASLPVRVPTVESLSSALSFAPSRFRTSRLTTVAVIDSVGNSHPDSIGTCRAHERARLGRSSRRPRRLALDAGCSMLDVGCSNPFGESVVDSYPRGPRIWRFICYFQVQLLDVRPDTPHPNHLLHLTDNRALGTNTGPLGFDDFVITGLGFGFCLKPCLQKGKPNYVSSMIRNRA